MYLLMSMMMGSTLTETEELAADFVFVMKLVMHDRMQTSEVTWVKVWGNTASRPHERS